MKITILMMTLVIGAFPPVAHSVKLYKWVDENGKVTYQDTPPPPHSAVRVEEKHIDPDENVTEFVSPKPSPPVADQTPGNTGTYSPGSSGGLSTSEKEAIVTGDRPLLRERRSGVTPAPRPRPAPARRARPPRPSLPRVPRIPHR